MLELKNISYKVTDENDIHVEKEILKDISLSIEEVKFIVITGPNGSGKSKLAKMIAGIIKPTSGSIILDGEDITEASVTDRAKMGMSFAFQQPVRFKGLNVFDMIKLATGNKKLTIAEACIYLSEVGLCAKDYINREVDASLSGGELKRIEIAMILARNTNISIFDEPEAGIDLWSFGNLIRVFEKIKEKTNGTIIIISHQERILNIADKILVLEGGVIKTFDDKDKVLPAILGTEAATSSCNILER
ncbi:MAG: ATP-binding cassette domain-containing protein [Eubacteriales bacterium]|nr:ATP-binding cassette domain-containing protein [Eubacteriales bacterium]